MMASKGKRGRPAGPVTQADKRSNGQEPVRVTVQGMTFRCVLSKRPLGTVGVDLATLISPLTVKPSDTQRTSKEWVLICGELRRGLVEVLGHAVSPVCYQILDLGE